MTGIILPDQDPTGYCGVCGEILTGGYRASRDHLTACAKQHIDSIRAASPQEREKGGPFDPESWDPEVEAHLKKVGEQMLKEGRWTVHPHEKAGFS